MSAFAEGSRPDWFQDIANAFASSRQTTRERRLQAFLATLYALFNDSSTAVSDDDLDRLTPRVPVMLILESLPRRG